MSGKDTQALIASTEAERRILALIEPEAVRLGLEIVRVRLGGGSKRKQLQIMVEKAGGAHTDVNDCANLSRAIGPVMEASDPISDAYVLEVSTPGIDRPLTRKGDFARWVGHLAKVELAMPLEGRRKFRGIILREDDDGAAIELDDGTELVAELSEMLKASLVLTDELIDAAQADGSLPPQPNEDGSLEGFEVEEDEGANP